MDDIRSTAQEEQEWLEDAREAELFGGETRRRTREMEALLDGAAGGCCMGHGGSGCCGKHHHHKEG